MTDSARYLSLIAALLLVAPAIAAPPGVHAAGRARGRRSAANPPRGARSLLFQSRLNRGGKPLRGIVDMHTHPMAHLGFGGKIIYGAPDVGLLLPARSSACNRHPRRARGVGEALGDCRNVHSGWNLFKNRCGSPLRKIVISGMEKGLKAQSRHEVAGYPDFASWPRHDDLTHQTMYVAWIKRAYRGGLRVLVTLAVNSFTLAKAAQGNKPYDDMSAVDIQLDETIRMVRRHKWMEVALSARDLRRIVAADKLAVIIGVETDDLGNFLLRRERPLHSAEVAAELRRLHRKGVRYIFPVHVIDNRFTGAAVYNRSFHIANKLQGGRPFDLACSKRGEGIGYRYQNDKFQDRLVQWVGLGLNPFGEAPVPTCGPGTGHVNRRGLSPIGIFAIREMMRLGMIIDIDHLSQRAVGEIFDLAEGMRGGYPLASSHARLRGTSGGTESDRTVAQYRRLSRLGGVAGIGWSRRDAPAYLKALRETLGALGGKGIALGTDFNGLVLQPPAPKQKRADLYGGRIKRYRFGRKTWDYNRDGVAHYGLVPDFLRDMELKGGADVVNTLFDSAEAYARMWERAERVSRHVRAGRPLTAPPLVTTKTIAGQVKKLWKQTRTKAKAIVKKAKTVLDRTRRKVQSWWQRTRSRLKGWFGGKKGKAKKR